MHHPIIRRNLVIHFLLLFWNFYYISNQKTFDFWVLKQIGIILHTKGIFCLFWGYVKKWLQQDILICNFSIGHLPFWRQLSVDIAIVQFSSPKTILTPPVGHQFLLVIVSNRSTISNGLIMGCIFLTENWLKYESFKKYQKNNSTNWMIGMLSKWWSSYLKKLICFNLFPLPTASKNNQYTQILFVD